MNQTLREKFENFSSLSDDECAFIITNHLIEAIESDVYIDWEIVSKFMTVPYPMRENLCKLFNSAIKKNQQKIENYSISEWIKRYLDKFAYKERMLNTFFDFVKNSEETQSLSKKNKIKLMRVLRIYDYLLVVPIFDLEGPVSNILRFPMWLNSLPQEAKTPVQTNTSGEIVFSEPKTVIENISISEALKQYPEIGDQLITLDHIKIRNSSGHVRPSIRNWLSDYVANLGFESHNSMMRGNYLFQNENAKILNYQDRQKLSQILKSFDEKTPLAVDASAKQVVFLPNKPLNKEKEIKTDWVSQNKTMQQEIASQAPKISSQIVSPHIQPIQSNYHPKIQEPGDNFEKVIGFEEKKSESFLSDIPKIVNLKEAEKEKTNTAKPFVKNLVNIKELLNTNKKEASEKNISETSFTSMPQKEKKISFIKGSDLPSSFDPSQGKPFSLSTANNSINHATPFVSQKRSWINNTIDPLDKTEKKLFESNNKAPENQMKTDSTRPIADIPTENILNREKTPQSNIQFTSPQKLSYEKEQEEIEKETVKKEKPPISQAPKMQPYRIRPASFEDN